ncbi:MAG: Crp/Fnr family transcriptional regulator [Acidobacteriota bacterium]|nr:Crp/Fnr family transcriptional regulator [Acidobacteriota bacterium]
MSTLIESLPKTSNRILNALTRSEYECLASHLDHVNLSAGEILYHPEQAITHVYFPNRGIVSVVSILEDGSSVEVGMVGNEGMFGVSAFLGSVTTPQQAVVQLPGDALRMRVGALKREFDRGGQLQDLLLRYTQAFITQIAQTAACNNAHHIDGRLARWLLMCYDRSQSKEMEMTQEFIAYMLGTRRAGVTVAAGQLRQKGLISYNRGHLTVKDRAGLEEKSCECYEIVKREFARLVGGNGHAVRSVDSY